MALIKCPECGKERVSDSAVACPECGYGIKEHFENQKRLEVEAEKERLRREEAEKLRMEKEARAKEERLRVEEEKRKKEELEQEKNSLVKESTVSQGNKSKIFIICGLIVVILVVVLILNYSSSNPNTTQNNISVEDAVGTADVVSVETTVETTPVMTTEVPDKKTDAELEDIYERGINYFNKQDYNNAKMRFKEIDDPSYKETKLYLESISYIQSLDKDIISFSSLRNISKMDLKFIPSNLITKFNEANSFYKKIEGAYCNHYYYLILDYNVYWGDNSGYLVCSIFYDFKTKNIFSNGGLVEELKYENGKLIDKYRTYEKVNEQELPSSFDDCFKEKAEEQRVGTFNENEDWVSPYTPPASNESAKQKHICEECSKESSHSIVGFSGQTEYYCTEHYNEMVDIIEMMQDSSSNKKSDSSNNYNNLNYRTVTDDDTLGEVWAMAQAFVKDKLKSPRTAKFPTYGNSKVSIESSGNYYKVIGYVDAKNSFNAEIRTPFILIMEKSGSNYKLKECTLIE